MSSSVLTEAGLLALLRLRHPAPEWLFFPHARNGTGSSATRTADALALNTFDSRGLELHGFEVKVSRGDWLRELSDPAKAETIAAFCNRWWLVVSDKALVQVGELPPTWGLLAASSSGLRVVVEASKLEAPPRPLTRSFVVALARQLTDDAAASALAPPNALIEAAVKLAVEKERTRAKKVDGEIVSAAEREVRDLGLLISAFEKAAGVSLHHATDRALEVGAALRFVLNGGLAGERLQLQAYRNRMAFALAGLDDVLAEQEQAANGTAAAQGAASP